VAPRCPVKGRFTLIIDDLGLRPLPAGTSVVRVLPPDAGQARSYRSSVA